ncbi:MAG TPA: hypothetical protein VHG28_21240 [Longimicrobiaceae bacterium]|nr:hypothetical protein [Longimicrobiaceae bacterium]
MKRLRIVLGVVCLLLWGGAAWAQEVQVPFDEEGRIEIVDAVLAARLGLWVDRYPGFREARLFQGPDSAYVLEITSVRDGRTVRHRTPLTGEQVRALRQELAGRVAERAPRATLNQEGRYLLLSQSTTLGAAFYGTAVPVIADAEEGSTAFSLYTFTTAASFFLPYLLTQDEPVTYGMANLSRYGASRGIAHGLLLYRLAAGDPEEECVILEESGYCEFDNGDERAEMATAVLASVAEGVGGYLWARAERMTAGTANAIGTGGDFGLLGGLGLAYLAGTADIGERATAAIVLPSAAAGIAAGRWVAARRDYTWGDADVIYSGGVLGAFTGWAATDLLGVDAKPSVAAAMLGAGAGLYLGDRLVQGTDFSVSQGAINRLGMMAGGLLGAGVGVLVDDSDPTAALTLATLGGALGYYGTYSTLAPAARAQRGESVAGLGAWRVRIAPEGVVGLVSGASPSAPTPVLSVQRSF